MLAFVAISNEISTLEHPEAKAITVDIPRFVFEIVSGSDRGRRFVFEPGTLGRAHVGRSQVSDFRLSDPQVSLRHAALDFVAGRLRLTDLDSRNGTFVEGVRIGNVYLSGGEAIRFGETSVRLDVGISGTKVTLPNVTRFGRVIGASPEMRHLYATCEGFALEDHPVLIEGETGTGKELLAEALHEVGPRASGPFVVFDCATVAPALLEAVLFGVEAGAFPGLPQAQPGAFEQADQGTLLLDEIGDLDVRLQSALLRAIDTGTILRVGAATPRTVDVRVLATTRRDLEREVEAGHFRQDLYYRLASRRLELPPLRQRRTDIQVLASHFWTAMGGRGSVPDELLQRAKSYAWPGNVQELMNVVARRASVGAEARSALDRMPPAQSDSPAEVVDVIADVIRDDLSFPHARRRVLDAFERRYLTWILGKHGGNVSRAAAAAGIARRYFYAVRSRIET